MESGDTGRGGATGYFSFLASRRPRLGRQNSGEMTEAGHTLRRGRVRQLFIAYLLTSYVQVIASAITTAAHSSNHIA